MPFNPQSHAASEITSQPDDWTRAVTRLADVAHALPAPGARIAVIGCGTSFYMAQAYAALRESRGQGESDAFAASEYPAGRRYDAVLALSRSGTTTEVIDALAAARSHGNRTAVIVATPGTPATKAADAVIELPAFDEQSVVQTRFATSVLALLRASLGEDLSPAVAAAEAVLAEPEAAALGGVAEARQITFVGRGWTVGLAAEAALKLRESTQSWTEAYSAMEYRHGPVSIATTGTAVWALGAVPPGLTEQVRATGAHFEHRELDPLAELVRVHRLCLARARQLDLDLDNPRHLTRSIVLTPGAPA